MLSQSLSRVESVLSPQERQAFRAETRLLNRLIPQSQATSQQALTQVYPDWRSWLRGNFARYIKAGFALRHIEFWDWIWALQLNNRPRPFVAIWTRGGAKSTSAELACALVGIAQPQRRKYTIYVCETQDQADKHIGTVASCLESAGIERAVNRYGSSRGWRRERLRCANGYTVDALGLDTATRGIKVEEDRPDFIVLDDIDGRHDSAIATEKKIETLTTTVLPTGSNDCAVLFIQNLIHKDSVAARLADGRADFLQDRIVSGPHKAIDDLQIETIDGEARIVGGTPTWEGQSIADCQSFIQSWSPRSFLRECQHDVLTTEGALWSHEVIDQFRCLKLPVQFIEIVVAVDPEVSSGEGSAETGIIISGAGYCDCKGESEVHGFVLEDATIRATPRGWARQVVATVNKWSGLGALIYVVAEKNQGGEMVQATIEAEERVPITLVHASQGKEARAEPIATMAERGLIHHVGYFEALENQLCNWMPRAGQPSPDRLDAMVWGMTELMPLILQQKRVKERKEPEIHSRWNRSTSVGGRWRR